MPVLCHDQGQGQAKYQCADAAANGGTSKSQGRTCFPLTSLDSMWQVLNSDKRRELSSSDQRHKWRLLAYPLLKDVSQRMRQVKQGRAVPSFVIFQGHDHTITSLLVALGIGDDRWPPFASRLTVELYKRRASRHDNGYFLRFLYNGRDVTGDLGWCRRTTDTTALCSLDSILTYLSSHKSGYFLSGSYLSDCEFD